MTTSSPKRIDRSIVLMWIGANAIGLTIGQIAGAYVGFLIGGLVAGLLGEQAARVIAFIAAQLITGASLGVMERLFLNREIELTRLWIVVSAVGWAGGFLIASLSLEITTQVFDPALSNALSWAVVGLGMGVAQFWVLRQLVVRAAWWIAFNIAAWTLAPLLGLLIVTAVASLGLALDSNTGGLLLSLSMGAVVGALTGGPLVRSEEGRG